LGTTFLAVCFFFYYGSVIAQRQNEKLNVVFILADDLGWSDLSDNGSNLHETPNFGWLWLNRELKFTNAMQRLQFVTPTEPP